MCYIFDNIHPKSPHPLNYPRLLKGTTISWYTGAGSILKEHAWYPTQGEHMNAGCKQKTCKFYFSTKLNNENRNRFDHRRSTIIHVSIKLFYHPTIAKTVVSHTDFGKYLTSLISYCTSIWKYMATLLSKFDLTNTHILYLDCHDGAWLEVFHLIDHTIRPSATFF